MENDDHLRSIGNEIDTKPVEFTTNHTIYGKFSPRASFWGSI